MIHLESAVIVEGKYDKIRLSSFLDAEIITTDGFAIFKDKEKVAFLRKIAEKRGLIILTDSDHAGFMIRGHLTSVIDPKYITNVFVPEISGKEKRKSAPSKQGLLGVEGISEEIILAAFDKAGVTGEKREHKERITEAELYLLGLSGKENSAALRRRTAEKLGLPGGMSKTQFLTALNCLFDKNEFLEKFRSEVL